MVGELWKLDDEDVKKHNGRDTRMQSRLLYYVESSSRILPFFEHLPSKELFEEGHGPRAGPVQDEAQAGLHLF